MTKKAMSGSNDGYVWEACVGGNAGGNAGGERRGMKWVRKTRDEMGERDEG